MPQQPTMLQQIVQTLYRLLQTPLFVAGLSALLCLLLSTSLSDQQHRARLDERSAHYGQALADLAAKQATDATLNHDLVSLQVTVSDVARNPDILSATIHDVENQLLVQAGTSPGSGDYSDRDYRSYSAPITLHDSVAGFVTITVDHERLYSETRESWLLALLVLAIALMVSSALNLRRNSEDDSQPGADTSAANDESQLPTRERENVSVSLTLYCLNTDALRQQLSASLRQQLYSELETQLSGISSLYGGKVVFASEQGLELQFQGDDLGSTGFRAICAAQLLLCLLQERKAPGMGLVFSGAVYVPARGQNLQSQLQSQKERQAVWELLRQQTQQTLLLDGQNCATSQTLQRIRTRQALVDGHWFVVDGLQPSYEGLLKKQLQQLQTNKALHPA
ncbi:hypothetical protein [Pseudomaricurvus sp. HS19]|uniref:hypothetical protein n=1 Tax=Pseudomaricurvus sp. HS19 TaxID=2692626 RepID=UPI0013702D9C|nr:hypothetical protein [Pseudomaricurvus sp. HS19]MYM64252.1 hypothetical protein [Pseudomaricurvus sp. HS19]